MGLNIYQRVPDDYHGLYPNPEGFPYVFEIDVIWPDTNIWPIRDWCIEHIGEAGVARDWCYQSDSVWFRHAHHAMEFKLRWL